MKAPPLAVLAAALGHEASTFNPSRKRRGRVHYARCGCGWSQVYPTSKRDATLAVLRHLRFAILPPERRTIECHVCGVEGVQFDDLMLPDGWGFVLDDDPAAEPLIAVGASAFYACEACKDPEMEWGPWST